MAASTSDLTEVANQLRDAGFTVAHEPPGGLRILADPDVATDSITVWQFAVLLSRTGGAWELVRPNQSWIRFRKIESAVDLVTHMLAIDRRERAHP